LRQRRELTLVVLLLLHRAQAGLVLCLVTGLFDLAVANGFEARLLFAQALLFLTATLGIGREASFLPLTPAPLGVHARLGLGFFLLLFIVVFLPDAVLLEAHQLLEGEENGGLFLFGHRRMSLGSSGLPRPMESYPGALGFANDIALGALGPDG